MQLPRPQAFVCSLILSHNVSVDYQLKSGTISLVILTLGSLDTFGILKAACVAILATLQLALLTADVLALLNKGAESEEGEDEKGVKASLVIETERGDFNCLSGPVQCYLPLHYGDA